MNTRQTSIACSVIRGGTSRGVFFLAKDLPADEALRDRVLTAVMGGPDALQIDGIGGGHSLTSKVAIVAPSSVDDADVDYLFLQVAPDNSFVSTAQNCGNLLAGVGPFAIENSLVAAQTDETRVRVHMVNSGNRADVTVCTPNGLVEYDGSTTVDGVPGQAAAIVCDFLDVAGSITGALFPTGNVADDIDGIRVTCIDNGMPVVLIRASDLGCSGYETPQELDANVDLKSAIESLRRTLGPMMNLGDVADKSVPKMCLIAAPTGDGIISTRTFIPHVCHHAIGVLAAVTVATACLVPGAITEGVAQVPPGSEKRVNVEHSSGMFQVRLCIDESADPENMVQKSGVIRTARILMRGEVFIPPHVWDGATGAK